jgi:uncharacterized protein
LGDDLCPTRIEKSQLSFVVDKTLGESYLSVSGTGVGLSIKVQVRAKKTALIGQHAGMLKIALKAPPVDGAANEELIRFLSQEFGCARSKIEIIKGELSREKVVRIYGVTVAQVIAWCKK